MAGTAPPARQRPSRSAPWRCCWRSIPKLTVAQIRQFLHQSALSDKFTKAVPNVDWGMGKLNVLGAADLAAATLHTNPALSTTTLSFRHKPSKPPAPR